MSVLFECEYQGERFVGFDRPGPDQPYRLHRVADGQVQAARVAHRDDAAFVAAVRQGAEEVLVSEPTAISFLPPFLPTATGNAMVSGFMRTHRSKMEGDRPEGRVDPPRWFFKGFGSWLRVNGEPLTVPAEPVALIEEPEVALVFVNDDQGRPHYAGYTFGNDLCDIGLHLKDPGYNPYCKLCDTSMAPWLFLGEPPRTVNGRVTIERAGAVAWEGGFDCGLDALYYRLEDMPDHLFTYPALRRPGMVNYLLLGADSASFHDGFRIADGDRVTIDVTTHDVRFSNVVQFDRSLVPA